MKEKLVIYTMKGCTACELLYYELRRRGIEFIEVDIHKDPEVMEQLIDEGFTSLPVAMYKDGYIVGFNPDAVEELLSEDA